MLEARGGITVDATLLDRHGPRLGLVALALLLRAPGLGTWWLNPDEGIYYSILTHERLQLFWAEAMTTAHPPLYFLILRAIGTVTTDFVWLRAVALLSGVAAVYVFILVGRELGGEGPKGWLGGLAAGLLLAVSPRAIVLSQVIRPYMLLILLLAGALLSLLRYLRRPSTRLLIAYASCCAVAVLLHYSSVFAIAVMGVLVLAEGVQGGFARPRWLRLLAAHAAPAGAFVTMYFWHLKSFVRGEVADTTIDCCLSAFMIHRPVDVWLSLVGFCSLLFGETFAVPAALLLPVVLVAALWKRAWTPFLAVATGLAIAVGASLTQLYPFGPTRHSFWLLVFVVPSLGWAFATALSAGRRAGMVTVALLVLLAAGAVPLDSVLDSDRRPHDISERVLRSAYLPAMQEALDPEAPPQLVLMSTETYHVLIPLFWKERQSLEASSDGQLRRFRWRARDVVVLPGRDFLALPSQLGDPNHLYTAMLRAQQELGVRPPANGEPVLVLAGGYESRGMADMVELAGRVDSLGTTTSVPGLIALSLDVQAYARALGLPEA